VSQPFSVKDIPGTLGAFSAPGTACCFLHRKRQGQLSPPEAAGATSRERWQPFLRPARPVFSARSGRGNLPGTLGAISVPGSPFFPFPGTLAAFSAPGTACFLRQKRQGRPPGSAGSHFCAREPFFPLPGHAGGLLRSRHGLLSPPEAAGPAFFARSGRDDLPGTLGTFSAPGTTSFLRRKRHGQLPPPEAAGATSRARWGTFPLPARPVFSARSGRDDLPGALGSLSAPGTASFLRQKRQGVDTSSGGSALPVSGGGHVLRRQRPLPAFPAEVPGNGLLCAPRAG
jgi:hypothetical protein